MKSAPNNLAEKKDVVRIRNAEGKWIFEDLKNGHIRVTYQFYGDPEGNIPSWIINLFIVDGPYDTLINLRSMSK